MTTTQRFVLDDKRNIIDLLNPTGPKGRWIEGGPQDEMHMREQIFSVRLGVLVDDLIINLQPKQTNSLDKPFDEESRAIQRAIYATILASQLNTLDVAVSIESRLNGKLKRRANALQNFTSLSLFRDDVERLLRDLYGDIESEALERTLHAVFVIVEKFAHYVRKDLWQEHQYARDWDYVTVDEMADICGTSISDCRSGTIAAHNLQIRAREVSENPSRFSKYTVEFATHINESVNMEYSYLAASEQAHHIDLMDAQDRVSRQLQAKPAGRIFALGPPGIIDT